MNRKKPDDILLIDHPLYDSFDEILFESEEEIYCLDPNTSTEAVLLEGEIYEAIHYSVETEEVQIRDEEGNVFWVEAELFVSCEDIELL